LLLEYSGRMQSDLVFATVLAVIIEALVLLAAMQPVRFDPGLLHHFFSQRR
jgi:hypothetical protein